MNSFKDTRCYTYGELMEMLETAFDRGLNKTQDSKTKELDKLSKQLKEANSYIIELEAHIKLKKTKSLLQTIEQLERKLNTTVHTESLLLNTIREQRDLLDSVTDRLEMYSMKLKEENVPSKVLIIEDIGKMSTKISESKVSEKVNSPVKSKQKSKLGSHIDKKV